MQFVSRFCLVYLLVGFACKQNSQVVAHDKALYIPNFNADSAYCYTKIQVLFGPRVPNTSAHRLCGNYLTNELRRFGANVIEQETTLQIYNKQFIQAKNIIASFYPENVDRILLCAHWDSRPFADQDPNPDNHRIPIDGASDGASACSILLEIAHQIGLWKPPVGIDIIFFDAEDYGTPEFEREKYGFSGWCLGSKYWAENPHTPNYSAKYGILLDMVSAPQAKFYKEYFSMQNANDFLKKIWETAKAIGYGSFFINKNGIGITDDHLEIFKYRRIPCVDIIHYDPSTKGFGRYWHTLNDNMNYVSKKTLKAVGQTILHIIYSEYSEK